MLVKEKIWAAVLGEVIGTGLIGSVLSYPVMTYLWGKNWTYMDVLCT
ncbi:MAG: energy coupling factor transporter S component ThiW [Paraclostridium bifermentans]